MKVVALKTFRNRKLGLLRKDKEYPIEDEGLVKELERSGLVSVGGEMRAAPQNKSVSNAPESKADPTSTGGQAARSSASPPGRASRKKTATKRTYTRKKK